MDFFIMFPSSLINQDVLVALVKEEAQKLFFEMSEKFQNELATNYTFDDKLLTREEVAKKLAVSKGTVDNMSSSGRLKPLTIGRSVRFRNSDVLEFIKRN